VREEPIAVLVSRELLPEPPVGIREPLEASHAPNPSRARGSADLVCNSSVPFPRCGAGLASSGYRTLRRVVV
jgi:hypothetical protein